MPETYGMPEDEDSAQDRFFDRANEVIAGNGIVRTVILYAICGGCFMGAAFMSQATLGFLFGFTGIIVLTLLMGSDRRLNG